MNRAIHIESFPNDVLLRILGNLSLPDIHHRVALVGQKWRILSKNVRFGPKYLELRQSPLNGTIINIELVEEYGGAIRHLAISKCIFISVRSALSFIKSVRKCENLVKLTMDRCFFVVKMAGFFAALMTIETLRKIDFKTFLATNDFNNSYIDMLLHFVSISGVDQLRLELPEEYVYKGAVMPENKLKKLAIFARGQILSHGFAKKLVQDNASTLNKLKLQYIPFDEDFADIVRSCGNLKCFSLTCEKQTTCQVSLRDMTINRDPLNCEVIKLKGLSVPANVDVDMTAWMFFENARTLKIILDFDVSPIVEKRIFRIDGVGLVFPKLTKLTVDGREDNNCGLNERITEEVAIEIASKFHALKILKIGVECESITFPFWQKVMNDFPDLVKVVIVKKAQEACAQNIAALRSDLTTAIPSELFSWSLETKTSHEMDVIRFAVERK